MAKTSKSSKSFSFNHKVGLTIGSLFALGHLIWVALVALGIGRQLLDYHFSMHFVYFYQKPYSVLPFDFATALLGILTAFIVGYIAGWVASWIWGYFNK